MKRYKIIHKTQYQFTGLVQLLPHTLRLRPRESHDLRIESSLLTITPTALLRWQSDVEGNSIAVANFTGNNDELTIISETIIQKYDQTPYDFLVADYAVQYPFNYTLEEKIQLSPYLLKPILKNSFALDPLIAKAWHKGDAVQSFSLLLNLNRVIHLSLTYKIREEPGVQSPEQSLLLGTGSCRDFAYLFMCAAQTLGFAARFVSGYIDAHAVSSEGGSTHAWVEIFLPGAGWKGFDPTVGTITGIEHIAVAVARLPELAPPIAGAFVGAPGAKMNVSVWVEAV